MSSSSSASEASRRLVASGSSVAALLVGDEGGAQSTIAGDLVAAWHCESPVDGEACRECKACGALSRDASGDVMLIEPGGPQDLIRLRQVVDDPAVPEPNIRSFLQSPPALGRNRIVWIERADRLSNDAANALLKTIEEPNERARFVLTTSASGRILPTIRSRCVLIPCDAPMLPAGFANELSGGSPTVFELLRSEPFADFLREIEAFTERVQDSKPAESIALGDRFQELAENYSDLRGEGEERLKKAEFVRLFANVAGARAASSARWRGLLDRCIVAHRAIVGNVNAGYIADWLFAAESEVQ